MDQQFTDALIEILREEITGKKEVHVEGLGVFKPQHKKQFQQQYDNGRVVMMPPEDKISFTSDITVANDHQ